jgi:8-oxo-dGTP diphosphatase
LGDIGLDRRLQEGNLGMTRSTASPIVGVGAVLLRGDGAILLGHRTKAGETASWCLPGGHVEPREAFEAAAMREAAEEAGIRAIADPRAFVIMQSMDAAGVLVTAGVLGRVAPENEQALVLEPAVFSSWIWSDPDDLPGPLFPASAAVIAAWRGTELPPGWIGYPLARPPYSGR